MRRGGKLSAAICVVGIAAAVPAGASASSQKTFKGTVPAVAAHTAPVAGAHGRVDVAVALRWRHSSELDRVDTAVSDPSSPQYGDFLSAQDFRSRYSPSDATVKRLATYMRSRGMRVTGVSASRMLVDVSGSVRSAERAFNTRLDLYRHGGHLVRAASKPASMPRRVARSVAGINGLSESVEHRLSKRLPPPPAFVNAGPCSNFWGQKFAGREIPPAYGHGQPYVPCGWDAQDLQSAYGVDTALNQGFDGAGETVAIVDAFAAPTIVKDVNEYSSRHGLPPANINQTVLPGRCRFGCHGAQGWYGEETLDLEAVHSMAPGATIAYYGAVDNSSKRLLDALAKAVDDDAASEVTNSYGSLGEGDTLSSIRAQEQVSKQAVAQGIGLYFSSGDDGDEHTTIGHISADYPASSPRVTAVGGTSLGVGPTGNRAFETGWGTKISGLAKAGTDKAHWSPRPPGPFLYGSGGGTSRLFREPSYQHHVVPYRLAGRFGGLNRVVPDLSMDGDPNTGMIVGETQTFPSGKRKYGEYRIGGTSLSSPLLAGYMADANQMRGSRLGFVNPALYSLYGSDAIRDVKSPRTTIAGVRRDFANGVNGKDGISVSLRSFDFDTSLKTKPGYDNVTGLGVPGARSSLMQALASQCKAC